MQQLRYTSFFKHQRPKEPHRTTKTTKSQYNVIRTHHRHTIADDTIVSNIRLLSIKCLNILTKKVSRQLSHSTIYPRTMFPLYAYASPSETTPHNKTSKSKDPTNLPVVNICPDVIHKIDPQLRTNRFPSGHDP